jgi:hypothetical protein
VIDLDDILDGAEACHLCGAPATVQLPPGVEAAGGGRPYADLDDARVLERPEVRPEM